MAWPTGAVSQANMDAGSDNPVTARQEINEAVGKINTMIAHTEPLKKSGDAATGPLGVAPGSVGYIYMQPGDASFPGYTAFHTADAVRRAYIGYSDGASNLLLQAENGWGWKFLSASGRVEFGSSNVAMDTATPRVVYRLGGVDHGDLLFYQSTSRGALKFESRNTSGALPQDLLVLQNSVSALLSSAGAQLGADAAGDCFIFPAVGGETMVDSDLRPYSDNTRSLGISGFRWTAVWAVNGTIQTSDQRDKQLLERIDPARAHRFIQLLEPWLFRWLIGGSRIERIEDGVEEFDEEVFEEVPIPSQSIELVNGQPILKRSPTTRRQVIDEVPVIDEHGHQVMVERDEEAGVKDKSGAPIWRRVQVPMVYQVPRTRKATKPKFKEVAVDVAGKRVHAGFIAQQVRSALEQAGLLVEGEACGLWVLDDPSAPDSKQSLRPDQLLPFIVAAMQFKGDAGGQL